MRVLIVEDDEDLNRAYTLAAKESPHVAEVMSVVNVKEALFTIEKFGQVDLIFLDHSLGAGSFGIELLEDLNRNGSIVPYFVTISAYTDLGPRYNDFSHRQIGYIDKNHIREIQREIVNKINLCASEIKRTKSKIEVPNFNILLKQGGTGRKYTLPATDVAYFRCEAENIYWYDRIHGEMVMGGFRSLSALEGIIAPYGCFCKINQTTLINIKFINYVEEQVLVLIPAGNNMPYHKNLSRIVTEPNRSRLQSLMNGGR